MYAVITRLTVHTLSTGTISKYTHLLGPYYFTERYGQYSTVAIARWRKRRANLLDWVYCSNVLMNMKSTVKSSMVAMRMYHNFTQTTPKQSNEHFIPFHLFFVKEFS